MNSYPLSVDEAQAIILAKLKPLLSIKVPLLRSDGYVLAESITADQDIPLFNRSMMDGYALKSSDVEQASVHHPIKLQVIDCMAAGDISTLQVEKGQAIRIMTGAEIPRGADAVCRFEATQEQFQQDVQEVHIQFPVKYGENIAVKGEDMAMGTVVLQRGTRIGPAEQAILATFGKVEVEVFRKPVVGIVATGSELISPDQPLQPGKIRNCNSYMLASMIRREGGEPVLLPHVGDEQDAIIKVISDHLPALDMVVTTGGVSVGDFDYIPEVYDRLGAITEFWKVLIRPGSPFRFAMREGVPFFGLSGNPAASFVNAHLFVIPALRSICGFAKPLMPLTKAILINDINKVAIKPVRYLRATAYVSEGALHVTLADGQSSGMIGSLVNANCFARIASGQSIEKGQMVDILLFDEVKLK